MSYKKRPSLEVVPFFKIGLGLVVFSLIVTSARALEKSSPVHVLADETSSEQPEKPEATETPEVKKTETPEVKKTETPEIQQEIQSKESETQINGTKIKTKTEDDGRTKVEFESASLKVHYEVNDQGLTVKSKDNKGEDVEATKKEKDQIESLLKEKEINVASHEGEIQIEHQGVSATTQFPLSIDQTTKQLVVTTPAGQKAVTVLPDQAVENAIRNGNITSLSTAVTATGAATPAHTDINIINGQLVYTIDGQKQVQLLGFIPVSLPTKVFVSTVTGQILSQEQSFLSSLLKLISR